MKPEYLLHYHDSVLDIEDQYTISADYGYTDLYKKSQRIRYEQVLCISSFEY